MKKLKTIVLLSLSLLLMQCNQSEKPAEEQQIETPAAGLIPVIFDTDTNNELDDQHALAYLLFNGNVFDVKGITVNATHSGGNIEEQYAEAERILKLCTLDGKIPLLKGADGNFEEIQGNVANAAFDGSDGVNFIIETARAMEEEKLVVIAVGKLTNVALALKKDPSIATKVRIVWLGSNYPEPGEYNQDNDPPSMSYLLEQDVPFEMVTVRYGKPSGTDAVKVTKEEANQKMPGKGPKIDTPVVGRHGVAFDNFGDYSVNLFEHIDYHGDPPSRALFDMVAVAVVKNPDWGQITSIPCPQLVDNNWVERPGNPRKIIVWENFDKEKILEDFYRVMDNYVLVNEQ